LSCLIYLKGEILCYCFSSRLRAVSVTELFYSPVFEVKARCPGFTTILTGFTVLPDLTGAYIIKGHLLNLPGTVVDLYIVSLKCHFSIFKMPVEIFGSGARIVDPVLLPFFSPRIIRVETFPGIPETFLDGGARPFFKDGTAVQHQADPAVPSLLPVCAKYFPFTDPKIKLPVWQTTAWQLRRQV
jgi:hypothetical protein